ncbi:MAG: fructosamine kinase family protein [Brumimicrobium sp.]|nr:fructosamine kinase family protein [Brumimicrobium sp.]
MLSEEALDYLENSGYGKVEKISPLSGGSINSVYKLLTSEGRYVLKKNNRDQFPKMLEKEHNALEYLFDKSPLRYPQPLIHFYTDSDQYLLMEYVESGSTSETGCSRLGTGLAKQHKITEDFYGWREDNYIGSLVQKNSKSSSWSAFYSSQRLIPLGEEAFNKGLLHKNHIRQLKNLCARLDEIYPEEKPALLHGDLWAGNYFIDPENNPVLYDPAIYFGHREIDIAMTLLFGGFPSVFYDSYSETFPLEKGWKDRTPISQLYPNLVHLNLFGSGYLSAILSVINKF